MESDEEPSWILTQIFQESLKEMKKERKENQLDAWRTRNPCPRENIDVLSDLID
jgi:hypothetical protein